jgi:photosystem II stability/assembly factor-like uncharacterized protein
MSDKKITELPPLTTPTPDDLLAIVNSDITKKIKLSDLFKSFIDVDLGLSLGFFLVPAGQLAPDGEYYYSIKTDSPVPILEGEITSGTPRTLFNDVRSKFRIDHSLTLPSVGWKKVQVNTVQINDIFFLDQMNGFSCTQDGKIFKTLDGGRTWTEKYSNGNTTPIKAFNIFPNFGRAIISPGLPVGNLTGSRLAVLNTYTSTEGTEAAAAIGNVVSAVGGTFIYYSFDFGETWQQQDITVPELQSGETYIDISGPALTYILGSKGTLIRYAPGGPSPTYIATLTPGDYTGIRLARNIIATPAPTSGFAIYIIANTTVAQVSTGHVYRSIDDGSTFTETLTLPASSLLGLTFLDNGMGWVVGGDGLGAGIIKRTNDAGNNWANTVTIAGGILRDVNFLVSDVLNRDVSAITPASLQGWAVGNGSTVVKTTDGDTWTQDSDFIPSQGSTHNLTAVSSIFRNVPYIGGDIGGNGNFYYFVPDIIDGVKYTYTPVDSVWMRVTFENNIIKEGFVTALAVGGAQP